MFTLSIRIKKIKKHNQEKTCKTSMKTHTNPKHCWYKINTQKNGWTKESC